MALSSSVNEKNAAVLTTFSITAPEGKKICFSSVALY